MTDTFSVREALSNPAVVREVLEHYRARLRSPDATGQRSDPAADQDYQLQFA